ncbi:MAG: CDP-diacylglycerol--glycerol-3-phosphate 3-phosphatidyltransferase [bacterium]
MGLANILTTLRIVLTPCCMLFILWDTSYSRLIALAIFVVAFLTDVFDGHVARVTKKVTNFGKLFDPLADKILMIAVLVSLAYKTQALWCWVAVGIIWMREVFIALMRRWRAPQGVATEANLYGKTKTLLQALAVCTLILNFFIAPYLLWVAAVFSLFSGVIYIKSWSTPKP